MHVRVPAGPRSCGFYSTPRVGYTMLIKGRCVTHGVDGNSSTNTVAWTIVQKVCGPLPMKLLRTTFANVARWVKHLEYHETRWDPDGTRT